MSNKDDDFADAFSTVTPSAATGVEEGVTYDDFFSIMNKSGNCYLYVPCRDFWPARSVNARLPPKQVLNKNGTPKHGPNGKLVYEPASKWLDRNRPIEAMTWAPGFPMQIRDRLIAHGGWIERKGVSCFNLYRPPRIKLGDSSKAGFWCDHLRRIYPDDAGHITKWLAHRVQRPGEKINHALCLFGPQGIGKDSILEALKEAVGRWNFQDIKPTDLFQPFNPFAKSVILRVNEAHDLGESNRFSFNDRLKDYIVVPGHELFVNEKHVPHYYVPKVCGIIITSNHKTDGIYLEADDRRHYVAWSNSTKEDFGKGYWNDFWDHYHKDNGFEHVAAYLTEFDLSHFDPMAHPPRTPAWHEIVNVGSPPEDAEIADVIDLLGKPDRTTRAKRSLPTP